jgi:hypothetical protein
LTAVNLERMTGDIAGFRISGQVQDRLGDFLRPRESRLIALKGLHV